jgi:hypothetical protein
MNKSQNDQILGTYYHLGMTIGIISGIALGICFDEIARILFR